MLKRTQQSFNSTFKPRTSNLANGGRLPKVSKQAAATRREVSRACPLDSHCLACGTSQQLTRSHILTQKQHPRQAANPLNVVTLCWQPCHCLWENDKPAFARQFPEAFAEKMRRMQLLDSQAYAFFRMKNPSLF